MRRGLSVRWRLTLVYSLISVLSATALLSVIYVLVSHPPRTTFYMGSATGPPGAAGAPWVGPVPPGDVVARGDEDEQGFYRVLVNARVDAVDDTLDRLLWWSGVGLLLTAAVSVGVGWLFAGRVLAPVHTITSRARAISADSLDERVSLGGPHDELRELADTFDSLLDRIHEAFAGERRLVATMSHELRTPLANQQVALDVALANPTAGPASCAPRPRWRSTRTAARPGPSRRCSRWPGSSPAPRRRSTRRSSSTRWCRRSWRRSERRHGPMTWTGTSRSSR